jgi:hypothetical protein
LLSLSSALAQATGKLFARLAAQRLGWALLLLGLIAPKY